MSTERAIATIDALVAASKDESVQRIVVSGSLTDAPSISLLPRQALQGADDRAAAGIAAGAGFEPI